MRTGRGRLRPLFFVLGLAGLAVVVSRWTDAVAVRGSSMAPTLLPGELLVVERWTFARRRHPRRGDVVLARDPRAPARELIKRVGMVGNGRVELRGDGAATTDSRTFGTVPLGEVEWRVVLRYWPLSRFGRIPPAPAPLEYEPEGGEPACTAFGDLVVGADDART